jgi:hypothetical protein
MNLYWATLIVTGALRPVAMQSTLDVMQQRTGIAAHVDDLCDGTGSPRS